MKNHLDHIVYIAKHHRAVLVNMLVLLASSLISTVILIGYLQSSNLQVWNRYASYGESFYRSSWVYFVNFIVQILVLGLVNNFIALKIMEHKGRAATLAFLGVSIFLVVFTLFVSLSLHGINREAGIWT